MIAAATAMTATAMTTTAMTATVAAPAGEMRHVHATARRHRAVQLLKIALALRCLAREVSIFATRIATLVGTATIIERVIIAPIAVINLTIIAIVIAIIGIRPRRVTDLPTVIGASGQWQCGNCQ